jgi:hypothetical protein
MADRNERGLWRRSPLVRILQISGCYESRLHGSSVPATLFLL